MAVIPVRLPPPPGEALDSWLEAYAHLPHVAVRDIFDFSGVDWYRVNGDQRTGKPWLCQLNEPDLAALGAATGVAPDTLAGMTLARYQGTGLAEATAGPRAGGASCPVPATAPAAWPLTAAGGCSPGGSRGPSPAPAARSCSPTPAPAAAGGTSSPATSAPPLNHSPSPGARPSDTHRDHGQTGQFI
jgi:hypothetical protein